MARDMEVREMFHSLKKTGVLYLLLYTYHILLHYIIFFIIINCINLAAHAFRRHYDIVATSRGAGVVCSGAMQWCRCGRVYVRVHVRACVCVREPGEGVVRDASKSVQQFRHPGSDS